MLSRTLLRRVAYQNRISSLSSYRVMASAIFPTSAKSTHGMSFSSCPMSRATIPQPLQASVSSPRIDYSASSRSAQDPYLSIPEKYRHGSLSGAQKELIKATVPALKAHGVDITKKFYGNMLGNHPELRDIFNNANQEHFEQPRALAQAVLAYAINIDDLTPLGPAVELMAAKHASLYVQPEQYSIVGKHLIEAIGQVLGEAVTPELAEAWTAAYWQLAEILIRREHELYQGAKGWTDWADFKIVKKVMESSEVTSFYLEPVDQAHKPLPAFSPGQFISIQVDVPSLGHRQTRQYSLSEEPNSDYYRISIKRENGANNTTSTAPGLISNLMHDTKNVGDTIRISHPMGDFFLDLNVNDSCPLVLLSGGVGLTPLMSMLNTLVVKDSTRPVSWIHGSRSAVVRPFTRHLKSLERSLESLQVTLFEENPGPDEAEGEDFDCRGIINLEQLDGMKTLFLNDSNAQYYICGPPAFMVEMEKDLLDRGIDPRKIHMEKFGTGGIQRAPQAVS